MPASAPWSNPVRTPAPAACTKRGAKPIPPGSTSRPRPFSPSRSSPRRMSGTLPAIWRSAAFWAFWRATATACERFSGECLAARRRAPGVPVQRALPSSGQDRQSRRRIRFRGGRRRSECGAQRQGEFQVRLRGCCRGQRGGGSGAQRLGRLNGRNATGRRPRGSPPPTRRVLRRLCPGSSPAERASRVWRRRRREASSRGG